jgi:hypothetical protein
MARLKTNPTDAEVVSNQNDSRRFSPPLGSHEIATKTTPANHFEKFGSYPVRCLQ